MSKNSSPTHRQSLAEVKQSLQARKTLRGMFAELDGMINQNQKMFLSNVSDEDKTSSTRIPKMSPRKRASLTVPKDLESPRSMGQKRRKVSRKQGRKAATPQQPKTRATKVQTGDRVKVVRGAKKRFLSRLGTVEKFLSKRQKWGIKLDDNHKICLEASCIQVISKAKRTRKPAPRARVPMVQEPLEEHNSLPGMASFKSLKVDAASSAQIKQYQKSFPADIRPKSGVKTAVAACFAGRASIIKGLVMSGRCDVNAKQILDGVSKSLADICIESNHPECALMLLEMCVEVDARDGDGRTPLMVAASHGQLAVVRAFQQAGADVNACDNQKSTALMYAAMHTHTEVVDYLLESGIDVDVTDSTGKNALAYAMIKNDAPHKRMVDAIIKRMYQKNLVVDSEAQEPGFPPRISTFRASIRRNTATTLGSFLMPSVRLSREFCS